MMCFNKDLLRQRFLYTLLTYQNRNVDTSDVENKKHQQVDNSFYSCWLSIRQEWCARILIIMMDNPDTSWDKAKARWALSSILSGLYHVPNPRTPKDSIPLQNKHLLMIHY